MADQTLRDFQHAKNLFTQQRLNFAPKTKFLYHVYFELSNEAIGKAPVTKDNERIINVLVKSVDLPGFSAQVETKNQYNRRKNIQTRIDYDPVTINFHDDNAGVSMYLLQEYYKYYFRDGNKQKDQDFGPRDKYSSNVGDYGLAYGSTIPFFKRITIYQLSRQEWNSYTLINPLVEKWNHDTMDSSDGTGISQNTMSVLYEGVLYDEGNVEIGNDPGGFGDPETGYDLGPSPMKESLQKKYDAEQPIQDRTAARLQVVAQSGLTEGLSANTSSEEFIATALRDAGQTSDPGGIPGVSIPTNISDTISSSLNESNISQDPETLVNNLISDPAALDSATRQALAQGSLDPGVNSSNFSDYNSLSETEKDALRNEYIDKVGSGDRKAVATGSTVVDKRKEISTTQSSRLNSKGQMPLKTQTVTTTTSNTTTTTTSGGVTTTTYPSTGRKPVPRRDRENYTPSEAYLRYKARKAEREKNKNLQVVKNANTAVSKTSAPIPSTVNRARERVNNNTNLYDEDFSDFNNNDDLADFNNNDDLADILNNSRQGVTAEQDTFLNTNPIGYEEEWNEAMQDYVPVSNRGGR